MNKTELIKAEIERQYEKYRDAFYQHKDNYHLGLYDGLDMALRVVNSLPEDKPSEDLEKAAESAVNDWLAYGDGKYANLFIAGAQWQKEQMMNYVQGKYDAYQEEYDDYYAGLRVAYGDVLKKLKEDEK